MSIEILVFEVAGQHFGVRAADVVQVLRAVSLSPLPQSPAVIEGLLNLRGCLVPVLDTRKLFGLPPRELRHTDHFIVVVAGGQVVTLHVDQATDLVSLERDPPEAAPAEGRGQLLEFVGKTSAGLVHVLDLPCLLCDQAARVVVESLAGRTATEVPR